MGRFVGPLRDRGRWVRLVRLAWFGRRGELASLCSAAGPYLDRGPEAPCNRDNPHAPLCSAAGPGLRRDFGIEDVGFDWCDRPGSAGAANWLRFVRQRGPAFRRAPTATW